jgi:hypothetical protein
VKKQIENVLNVRTTKFGKTEKEKLETDLFKDTSAENVSIGLVNRQFYQLTATLVLGVKYA